MGFIDDDDACLLGNDADDDDDGGDGDGDGCLVFVSQKPFPSSIPNPLPISSRNS